MYSLKAHPLTILFGILVCHASIYVPSNSSTDTNGEGEWVSWQSIGFRMSRKEFAEYGHALEGLPSTAREERKRGFVAGMQDAPIATGARGEQFMVGYESAVRSRNEWNFWRE